MEIDILVVNAGYVVLVEVKSTLKVDDVRAQIERLGQFREFFPEYADKQVLGRWPVSLSRSRLTGLPIGKDCS